MIIWGFSIQIWPEYHFYSSFPPLDEFAFLFFPGLSRSISLKRQETGNRKQRGGHSQCWLLFFFFFLIFYLSLSFELNADGATSKCRSNGDGWTKHPDERVQGVAFPSRPIGGEADKQPQSLTWKWSLTEPTPGEDKDRCSPHNKVEADFCCVVVLDPGSDFSLSKQAAAVLNCILHSRSKTATN